MRKILSRTLFGLILALILFEKVENTTNVEESASSSLSQAISDESAHNNSDLVVPSSGIVETKNEELKETKEEETILEEKNDNPISQAESLEAAAPVEAPSVVAPSESIVMTNAKIIPKEEDNKIETTQAPSNKTTDDDEEEEEEYENDDGNGKLKPSAVVSKTENQQAQTTEATATTENETTSETASTTTVAAAVVTEGQEKKAEETVTTQEATTVAETTPQPTSAAPAVPQLNIDVLFEPKEKNISISEGNDLFMKCVGTPSIEGKELFAIIHRNGESLFTSENNTLEVMLRNVAKTDAGTYECYVFTKDRQVFNTSTIIVKVTTPQLQLDIEPSVKVLGLEEGEDLEIKCTAKNGNTSVETSLYRDNRLVAKGNETLVYSLKQVNVTDAGKYLCYAHSSDKVTFKDKSLTVNIEKAREAHGFAKESIELPCGLVDLYNDSIQWRRPHSKLDQNVRLLGDGHLRIVDLKPEDAGFYECYTLSNRVERVRLVVGAARNITHETNTYLLESEIKARQGETIRQTCMSTTTADELRLSWYRDKREPIRNSGRFSIKTLMTQKNPITYVSVLTIRDVKASDYGEYECWATAHSQPSSSTFKILESNNTEMTSSPSTKLVRLNRGQSFDFTCSYESSLVDVIQFIMYKDNIRVNGSLSRSVGVKVTNARKITHEGEYKCKAWIRDHNKTKIESRSIRVFVDSPNELVVTERSNISLSCLSQKHSDKVEWKKVSGEIDQTRHKLVDGRLRLQNVRAEDAGEYRCWPRSVGPTNSQSGKIELFVLDAAKDTRGETTLKSEKVYRKPGEQAEQVCTGKSTSLNFEGSIIIDWFNAHGQKIQSNSKYEINEIVASVSPALIKTSQLVIKSLDGKDYGSYSCQITYGLSVDTANFTIQNSLDITKSAIVRISESRIDMEVGDSRDISCFTNVNTPDMGIMDWIIIASNRAFNQTIQHKFLKTNGSVASIRAYDQSLDGGYLTCRVESLEGVLIAQDSIMIRIRQRSRTGEGVIDPDINVQVAPKQINATIGDLIHLHCTLQLSSHTLYMSDRLKYVWTKDGRALANEYSSRADLAFTVKSVSESGEYACRAVDRESNRESNAAVAHVHVSVRPDQVYVEITRYDHAQMPLDRVVRAKETDDVRLKCELKNAPRYVKANMRWLKLENRQEFPIMRSVVAYDLPLLRLQTEHAGRYYCIAHLDDQQVFDYIDLDVDRYEPIELESKLIDSGDDLSLGCRLIRGLPKPTLTWKRIDNVHSWKEQTWDERERTLFIDFNRDELKSYDNWFICTAENKYQTLTSQIYAGPEKPFDGWTTTKSPLLDWSNAYMHWQDASKSRHFVQLSNDSSSWLEFDSFKKIGEFALIRAEPKSGDVVLFDSARKLYIALTSKKALYGTSQDSVDKLLSEGEWLVKNEVVTVPAAAVTTNAPSTTTTSAPDDTNKVFVINGTRVVDADAGASFDLYCATRDINNKAFVSIEWSRRGDQFASNTKHDKNLLQIVDFNDANEGQYECAYIKDLTVHKFVITLVVRGDKRAPTVRVEPSSLIAYVGDPINVTCLTTGNPRPWRKWLLNGQDIKELAYNFRIVKNTLYIGSVTRDLTSSTITCEAHNNVGEPARASTHLTVKYRSDGLNSLTASLVLLENNGLGRDAKFLCNHTVDYKTFINRHIEIMWRKDGHPLSDDDNDISDFDHLTVKLNSADDYGTYSCQVVDFDNGIESELSQIAIQSDGLLVTRTTLAPTTTAVPVPQVIVNGNRHLDYVTSTNVDLVCQSFKNLDKNETKTIWQRKSTPEWPENFKIDNNVLHIRNLKESDAGMYECIIRHNGISQNMFVTLNVTRKPEPATAQLEKKLIRLQESEKIVINCYTSGHPKPTVEWFLDEKKIESEDDFYIYDTMLFVTGTEKTNGVLSCRAENSYNDTDFTAESLAVLVTGDERKVAMAEIVTDKSEVGKGEEAELTCKLTASYTLDNPDFVWFGPNGKTIAGQTSEKLTVEFGMLDETKKASEFACRAKDAYASVETNKAKINVTRKLKKIEFDILANTLPALRQNLTLRVNKTQSLQLECRAKDLDNSTIETVFWMKVEGADRTGESKAVSNTSLLSFENLQVRDSGKYYCVVDERYESESIVVQVDEYEPISLQIFVRERDIEDTASTLASDEVVLLCTNLRGKPVPKVEWLYDNGSPVVNDTNVKLSANQFGLELRLSGAYGLGILKCVATNEAETKIVFINTRKYEKLTTQPATTSTTPSMTWANTRVPSTQSGMETTQRKPRRVMRVVRSQRIDLSPGDNLDIYCAITNETVSNKLVQWLRMDRRIMDRNVLTNKDVLKITNFDPSNAADYECIENTESEELTLTITLRVKQPKLEARLRPLKWKIPKGRTDYIKCEAIYPGVPNAANLIRDVVWTLNNKMITNYANIKAIRNELRIEDASVDLNNSVLKCRLIDQNSAVAETQTQIVIVEPETTSESGAAKSTLKITSNRNIDPVTNQVIVRENEDLELKCSSSLDSSLIINWNKQDDQLDPSRHQISDDQLIIRKIQLRDGGKYACRGQQIANPNESDQVKTVHVVVEPTTSWTSQAPVQILTASRAKITLEFTVNHTAETIQLTCEVRSGREHVVGLDVRKLNNQLEDISNPRNYDLPPDFSHVYFDLDNIEENYGTYVCSARDINDRLTETFAQVVAPNRKPESVLQPNPIRIGMKYRILDKTDTFELNCTILRGHPIRSLKIIRGFGSSEELNYVYIDQTPDNTHASAVIQLIPSNVGKYYCQAKNDFESTSSELIVSNDGLGTHSLNSGIVRREKLHNQIVASSPEVITKYVGESAMIDCALVAGDDSSKQLQSTEFKYIWTPLKTARTEPLDFDQFSGRIVFNNLKLQDAGTYSCQIYSDYNPKLPLANVVSRLVVVKRPNTVEPRVRIFKVGDSPDGRNPFVKCESTQGEPTPRFYWRRQDGQTLSMRVIVNGGLMHIQDASPAEYGVYECVGQNEAGEHVAQFVFEKNAENN